MELNYFPQAADRFNYFFNCSKHRFYKVWFGSKVLTLRPIIEANLDDNVMRWRYTLPLARPLPLM
jgi:hypothetical protein